MPIGGASVGNSGCLLSANTLEEEKGWEVNTIMQSVIHRSRKLRPDKAKVTT